MTWDAEMAKLARYEDLFRRLSESGKEKLSQYGKTGDPANHVEFESEIRRREAAKQKRKEKR